MINYIVDNGQIVAFTGILTAFFLTCICMSSFSKYLPKDMGRQYAHDGKLSAGKPRGAGFIFVLVFIVTGIVFGAFTRENIIYIILLAAAMMTGFLDDCAKTPWGEYKKGILDLIIAIVVAVTYLNFNTNTINIIGTNNSVTIHPVVFGILVVVLVWTSINVTNCADGVDGLSGTLALVTLGTVYMVGHILGKGGDFSYLTLVFMACILGYLWFNATPSLLMMGDAGSRAMGLFIAIAVLKTESPIVYIPAAIVLIVDGGLGLVKVALLRFLKIKILKNTRTPLHDHVRKVWNWSNTHTVYRFAIIQAVVGIATVYIYLLA